MNARNVARHLLCAVVAALPFVVFGAVKLPSPAPKLGVANLSWGPQLPATFPAYDIICSRAPRNGTSAINWGHVANVSLRGQAGTDLVRIHFNADGTNTVQVLVAGGPDACVDPCLSFDGKKCFFTRLYKVNSTPLVPNVNWPASPSAPGQFATGADIFVVDLATLAVTRLTNGEYTPNRAADDGRTYPIWNAQPCMVPGGKPGDPNRVVFCSNRNGYIPPRTAPTGNGVTLQLYIMDEDGSNVERIGSNNVGGVMGPSVLRNGSIAFSTLESQGLRMPVLWSKWTMDPDGSSFGPLFFNGQVLNEPGDSFHDFGGLPQRGDGRIFQMIYYEKSPAGGLVSYPEQIPGQVNFTGADGPTSNTSVSQIFMPKGLQVIMPWSNGFGDGGAPLSPDGINRVGKVTHVSAAPSNDMLVMWTGPDDGNMWTAAAQAQICLIPGGNPTTKPGDMKLLVSDPNYHFFFPRALSTYQDIYGIPAPQYPGDIKNDGTIDPPNMQAGTPYAEVGTASLWKIEAFPRGTVGKGGSPVTAGWNGTVNTNNLESMWQGLGKMGTLTQGNPSNGQPNLTYQGGTIRPFFPSEIAYFTLIGTEPISDADGPFASPFPDRNLGYTNLFSERLRVLAHIPVGNGAAIDPDGNPDTSFMAKVTANRPVKFQLRNKDMVMLVDGQTWHSFAAGEKRVNCGGCHAHSQIGTDFSKTVAGQPGYKPFDATKVTQDVEFYRDIQPMLQAKCVACHTKNNATPPANLVFDDMTAATGSWTNHLIPKSYAVFTKNRAATYGGYPTLGYKGTPEGAGGRYYAFAAKNIAAWKVAGKRLDGMQDGYLPAPTTFGDPTTLQKGQYTGAWPLTTLQQYQLCDQGWSGVQCPPPGAKDSNGNAILPLTADEQAKFFLWCDLGHPLDFTFGSTRTGGWMDDNIIPTLCMTTPTKGTNAPLTTLLFGAADDGSGLDPASLSVTADFAIDGKAPGTELAPLFASNGGIYSYTLQTPIGSLTRGTVTVKAADKAGNRSRLARTFSVSGGTPPPPPPPSPTLAQNLATAQAQLSAALTALQQAQAALNAAQQQVPVAAPRLGPLINQPPLRVPKGGKARR